MAIQWTLKTLQCNKINHYIHLIKSIITIKYNKTKFKLKTNQTLTREIIFPIITKKEMFFNNLEIILEMKLENFIISCFDISFNVIYIYI